jgi:hypothetical protein
MSVPKPASAVERDPVLAAFEDAPLDVDALTLEEAAEFEARMARGSGRGRSSEAVLTELTENPKRDG